MKPTPGFYGEVLFTIPSLGWKVVQTPQGWAYEYPDGTHGWPDPMQKELIRAYRNSNAQLVEALRALLTQALAIHGDDLADARTIDAARAALALAAGEQEDGATEADDDGAVELSPSQAADLRERFAAMKAER